MLHSTEVSIYLSHFPCLDQVDKSKKLPTVLVSRQSVYKRLFVLDWHFLRNFTVARSHLIEGGAILQSTGIPGRGVDMRVPEAVRIPHVHLNI